MAKKSHVNKDLCISCGMCTAVCADGFAFGDDGKAEFVLPDEIVTDEVASGVDEAVASCPVQAIEVAE